MLVICGSLRKGSYNAALARTLPGLAPPGLTLTSAPSFAELPIYNFDLQQCERLPGRGQCLGRRHPRRRRRHRRIAGIQLVDPRRAKNAIDWVSRMKEQPFKDKPVALQSAAGGILGGSRMQYHLRQSLTSIDALLFGRPEVIVTFAAQKFDEKTLELKDQTAIDLVKQQLAGFEKFIRRHSRRGQISPPSLPGLTRKSSLLDLRA